MHTPNVTPLIANVSQPAQQELYCVCLCFSVTFYFWWTLHTAVFHCFNDFCAKFSPTTCMLQNRRRHVTTDGWKWSTTVCTMMSCRHIVLQNFRHWWCIHGLNSNSSVFARSSWKTKYTIRKIRTHWRLSTSQLQYACPAWWGYLKADERNRLQSIISKAIRYSFLQHSFCTLDELREDADEKLFFSSRYNPNHALHRLLPQPKRNDYNLHQRTHNLTLPTDGNSVMKQNFVYRTVFKTFIDFYQRSMLFH